MQKIILLSILIASIISAFICDNAAFAQNRIKYKIESNTNVLSNETIPFWLRSNQNGSIPLKGISNSFIAEIHKEFGENSTDSSDKIKNIDWGFGIESRANVGKGSNLTLIQAYGKMKIGPFQINIGRSRDIIGINGDSTLSSGNFTLSGNALGIPKIEVSFREYYALPFLNKFISIKGNFAHGYLGHIATSQQDFKTNVLNIRETKTYFHQKSFYTRLGSQSSKLKLYGGFNHNVFWGSENEVFGSNYTLNGFKTFYYVISGKAYGNKMIPHSKIGNQLGSVDLAIEYEFDKIMLTAYRQNFYDVGALAKLANIRDGLNGISVENKLFSKSSGDFKWKKMLFEIFYSYNQAGESWSKLTKSGDEDYYNNYFYLQGWSYNGLGLGSPFITSENDARNGQPNVPGDFFINNRVIAAHAGIEGEIRGWQFLCKLSYSMNYGTFGTSPRGKTTDVRRVSPNVGLFGKVSQFSGYIETNKRLKKDLTIGYVVAMDGGKLLNTSVGGVFKIAKNF